MTLTELKYIVAVARHHHFGHAAEACFVAQPTLSVAIKKLEEELGVILFERGGSEITTTPIGARVIAQAEHVLEQTAAIKEIAGAADCLFHHRLLCRYKDHLSLWYYGHRRAALLDKPCVHYFLLHLLYQCIQLRRWY